MSWRKRLGKQRALERQSSQVESVRIFIDQYSGSCDRSFIRAGQGPMQKVRLLLQKFFHRTIRLVVVVGQHLSLCLTNDARAHQFIEQLLVYSQQGRRVEPGRL